MQILYIYQYFSTPRGSWGTRAYEFAKRWVEKGHKVTVLTSVYDKSDLSPRGLFERFEIEGIDVLAVNVHLSNKHGILKRILTFSEFLTLATWLASRSSFDVIIASSGPLTVGIPGVVARLLRRGKLVFEMRDIFSEGVRQVGTVKSVLLYKLLKSFELRLCRQSEAVVVLSPGMAEWVKLHIPDAPVTVVPNVSDNDLFRAQMSVDHSSYPLRAVFTGTIGAANHCRYLLDTAEALKLQGVEKVRIELIGDGKERQQLETEAAERRLTNLQFRDLMPKVQLAKELSTAAIALLVLKPIPVFDTASPNKLFDALAAGLPVVQTTQGWIKDMLEREGCGLTVPQTDPNAMADAIMRLASDAEMRYRMGCNAKRVAKQHFDRRLLADRMLDLLEIVSRRRRKAIG